jgi:hypothetical protein
MLKGDSKGDAAMRLTWKDAVSTVTLGMIAAVYVAFLADANLPIIGSAPRAASQPAQLRGVPGVG